MRNLHPRYSLEPFLKSGRIWLNSGVRNGGCSIQLPPWVKQPMRCREAKLVRDPAFQSRFPMVYEWRLVEFAPPFNHLKVLQVFPNPFYDENSEKSR